LCRNARTGDGYANLNSVFQVVSQIAAHAGAGCVVAVKSTVPIGTNDRIESMLATECGDVRRFCVVSNPEFLAQGSAVRDTLHASRIVVGVESESAEYAMRKLYQNFDAPVIVTDRRSAEMIKYAANNFLALKLSYINEIANLCEMVGADVTSVAQGIGIDPRIGAKFLNAGIGYGGSTVSRKIPSAALAGAQSRNMNFKTVLKAAIEVNENQKLKLLKKASRYYPSLEGKTVAVLGLTFKPETDDLRDAPSLQNLPVLIDCGAFVKVWDPVAMPAVKKLFPTELLYCNGIDETLAGADLCLISRSGWQIVRYDIRMFSRLMKHPSCWMAKLLFHGMPCFPQGCFTIRSAARWPRRISFLINHDRRSAIDCLS
jgi:UDPglucose 6-dehydrogenase